MVQALPQKARQPQAPAVSNHRTISLPHLSSLWWFSLNKVNSPNHMHWLFSWHFFSGCQFPQNNSQLTNKYLLNAYYVLGRTGTKINRTKWFPSRKLPTGEKRQIQRFHRSKWSPTFHVFVVTEFKNVLCLCRHNPLKKCLIFKWEMQGSKIKWYKKLSPFTPSTPTPSR